MTVLHSGSNKQFASGWEHVFAKGAKKKPAAAKAAPSKKAAPKSAKKSAKKKGKK
jgi:hypothetical protein